MKKGILSIAAFVVALSASTFGAQMDKEPAFGGDRDLSYSKYLWGELEAKKLNSTTGNLYVGGPPHGPVREVIEGEIDGQRVIVKRNYGGEGVSIKTVSKDRAKYLKAITVMIRKKGYDPKNNDWYWAKYKADGTLHATPDKKELAGKVPGCIGCHNSASGNDLVFAHNKEANADVTFVGELNK